MNTCMQATCAQAHFKLDELLFGCRFALILLLNLSIINTRVKIQTHSLYILVWM